MKCSTLLPVIFLLSLQVLVTIGTENSDDDEDRSFVIDYEGNGFLKDGEKFRYVSGSIHYFRSMEEQWNDRLRKMRLAGLNAITTYVAWNLHQPSPEPNFNYAGNLNLFKFLETAQQNQLLVILRPGPYMDAERDMGGLPAWLLWEKPNMQLRTSDLDYVYFVSRWFDELLPKLRPYLYENGGPIITVQVENEYGSYACDKNYTEFLRDLIRFHLGPDIVLFSTDGAFEWTVKCGSLPDVYTTVDFGPDTPAGINNSFSIQRKYSPKGPLINSEFYPGWLDHWQKTHSKVSTKAVTSSLDTILAAGANVNIYMFHGGTSFGYGAGANIDGGVYDPNPTSYDYDAPLDEAGDPTDKYFGIKGVIAKYMDVPKENPAVSSKGNYGKIALRKFGSLHSSEFLMIHSDIAVHSVLPQSFEELQVAAGFVLYQVKVPFVPSDPALLSAPELKDRAYIYVDKVFQGVISRQDEVFSIPLMIRKGQVISILVENQGRVCFGKAINEGRGPGQNVTLGPHTLKNWEIFRLGEIDGKKLTKYSTGLKSGAIENHEDPLVEMRNAGSGAFFVGNFTIPDGPVLDTYVRFDGFTKGMIWINEFNLGRYWPVVGPQVTLYLPGPLLKAHPATNTVIIFELERAPDSCLTSLSTLSKLDIRDEANGDDSNGGNRSNGKCFISLTDTPVIDAPTPYKDETPFYKLRFSMGMKG